MEGELYYVYVLKVANGGYYVGSTKNLEGRIKTHFSVGGAIATKESSPVEVVEVLKLIDYKIGARDAHLILEIATAVKYALVYGSSKVRGAKHGKDWKDSPTPSGLKIIHGIKSFIKTEAYQLLMKRVDHVTINHDLKRKLPKHLFK